jgi:hypothetical protein
MWTDTRECVRVLRNREWRERKWAFADGMGEFPNGKRKNVVIRGNERKGRRATGLVFSRDGGDRSGERPMRS